jgi:hypothetical protein
VADLSQGGGTPFAQAPEEAQLAILDWLNAHEAMSEVLASDVTLALIKVQMMALHTTILRVLSEHAPGNTIVPRTYDSAQVSEAVATALLGDVDVPDHVPDLWPEGGTLA